MATRNRSNHAHHWETILVNFQGREVNIRLKPTSLYSYHGQIGGIRLTAIGGLLLPNKPTISFGIFSLFDHLAKLSMSNSSGDQFCYI